jgi:hypothetical protein
MKYAQHVCISTVFKTTEQIRRFAYIPKFLQAATTTAPDHTRNLIYTCFTIICALLPLTGVNTQEYIYLKLKRKKKLTNSGILVNVTIFLYVMIGNLELHISHDQYLVWLRVCTNTPWTPGIPQLGSCIPASCQYAIHFRRILNCSNCVIMGANYSFCNKIDTGIKQ